MGIYLQTEIGALKDSLTFIRGELIKTAETEKIPWETGSWCELYVMSKMMANVNWASLVLIAFLCINSWKLYDNIVR